MNQAVCPKCGRIFEGQCKFSVDYEMREHYKYCVLATRHKVLRFILIPLAVVGIGVFIPGVILYFLLAPIAYPFIYALSLCFDNDVITWQDFTKKVYDTENTVRSRKPKREL